jgi:hypothetical protein
MGSALFSHIKHNKLESSGSSITEGLEMDELQIILIRH